MKLKTATWSAKIPRICRNFLIVCYFKGFSACRPEIRQLCGMRAAACPTKRQLPDPAQTKAAKRAPPALQRARHIRLSTFDSAHSARHIDCRFAPRSLRRSRRSFSHPLVCTVAGAPCSFSHPLVCTVAGAPYYRGSKPAALDFRDGLDGFHGGHRGHQRQARVAGRHWPMHQARIEGGIVHMIRGDGRSHGRVLR
ncbi:hypothetical protein RCH05_003106 [Janthinobacterium sp. CAN_S7]